MSDQKNIKPLSKKEAMIAEIHELAIQIQKKQEENVLEEKKRKELGEKIEKLKNVYADLIQSCLRQKENIERDREDWRRQGMKFDKASFEAKEEARKLQEEITSLKKELSQLVKIEGEIKKAKRLSKDLASDIKALSKTKETLEKDVASLEVTRDQVRSEVIDVKSLASTAYDDLGLAIKNTQDYRNHVYFYIKRIVQWYREQGKKAPQIFEEFKPNVPIRADVLKKLKQLSRKNV